jgi:pimeloyl-ACP methyl ester carboxylesterase
MDATSTAEAIPISFSTRAVVGLRLCVEHADRVLAAIFTTPDPWPSEFYVRQMVVSERDEYADEEIFNFHYMRADWSGFAERWAKVLYPNKHSTKQREDAAAYMTDTDAEAFIASVMGRSMLTREEALEMAARVEAPTLVLQNGGESLGEKGSSGPLAEALGGRLRVFEGKGPLVVSRWPVLFNLAVREFCEEVRASRSSRVLRAAGPAR